jgi:hypothetical protein
VLAEQARLQAQREAERREQEKISILSAAERRRPARPLRKRRVAPPSRLSRTASRPRPVGCRRPRRPPAPWPRR